MFTEDDNNPRESMFNMSSKHIRIRMAICFFMIFLIVFVIAIIVVFCVLFIPRAPTIQFDSTGMFPVRAFNITYCPNAHDGESCCNGASGTDCQFEVNTAKNLVFQQEAGVLVDNPNVLRLSLYDLTVILSVGGREVVRGRLKSVKAKQTAKSKIFVPIVWDTVTDRSVWRDVMCQLSDPVKEQVLEVSAKLDVNVKYFAVKLKTQFDPEVKYMDMKSFCNLLGNKCQISPAYRSTICN